ncbi:uncharacterized protein LOC131958174 [Physella acuta]|uniref:uncharacterized protein LOC131958174 n=1 Tax=Physella acuta TaxID=109671 RepID=UPI0027DD745A|nr:uncharacterized protein LOC131958174 [Physella acuta]
MTVEMFLCVLLSATVFWSTVLGTSTEEKQRLCQNEFMPKIIGAQSTSEQCNFGAELLKCILRISDRVPTQEELARMQTAVDGIPTSRQCNLSVVAISRQVFPSSPTASTTEDAQLKCLHGNLERVYTAGTLREACNFSKEILRCILRTYPEKPAPAELGEMQENINSLKQIPPCNLSTVAVADEVFPTVAMGNVSNTGENKQAQCNNKYVPKIDATSNPDEKCNLTKEMYSCILRSYEVKPADDSLTELQARADRETKQCGINIQELVNSVFNAANSVEVSGVFNIAVILTLVITFRMLTQN